MLKTITVLPNITGSEKDKVRLTSGAIPDVIKYFLPHVICKSQILIELFVVRFGKPSVPARFPGNRICYLSTLRSTKVPIYLILVPENWIVRKIKLFHQKHDKGSSLVIRSHNTSQQWKLSFVGEGGSETARCYNRCVPHTWVFCHRYKHVLTAWAEKNLHIQITKKLHCIQRSYCIRTIQVLKPNLDLEFGNGCNWEKRLYRRWSSWDQMFDAETRFLRCM